ncbi:trimeric intracellular cation channel family protein [Hoylesella buccalis]|uniref:trimeric intracellular cation channel family protein n=1 Tax=Hoylesella buccalis TaxID=28127 RepID=UPI001D1518D7|nr:trimeric intracellular cation channel family protein [Hoylesella buccalis]UEA63193.1 trimeric intracellular cation channel family protein [Hoylesella buccalis]UWP49516.1 trimeric intracellular cation channel family protein [Hoylesella buccalis ATCC 35310]
MFYQNPEIVHSIQQGIEFVGTFAFAISGIRHAAAKNFDWFGGFVCGIAVAIGGGTIRDVMIGVTPFWMTSSIYIICTVLAQLFVIVFSKFLRRLDNTWFVFDTLGLALFTIAGIQKSLAYDFPFWVAIIMGCITGSAGGVIRDVLLNNVPIIFQKEIYAMASILGGLVYWVLISLGVDVSITVVSSFLVVCVIRFLAVRYHLSLPRLRLEE